MGGIDVRCAIAMGLVAEMAAGAIMPVGMACAATTKADQNWVRLAGDDRYQTMAKVIGEAYTWTEPDGELEDEDSAYIVVASGESYPDALAASALAGALEAPVFLTGKGGMTEDALEIVDDLDVKSAFILGGEDAVSANVESQLAGEFVASKRVAGRDRYQTSVEVLKEVLSTTATDTVIVATGGGFADALSVGPVAYAKHYPIVLAGKDGRLSDAAVAAITSNAAIKRVILVGGVASVSDEVGLQLGSDRYAIERWGGEDRYQTSARIATEATKAGFLAWTNVSVATGRSFPDALAGAAFTGFANYHHASSVLLLADKPTDPTVALLAENKSELVGSAYILGGTSSVSADIESYLNANVPCNLNLKV